MWLRVTCVSFACHFETKSWLTFLEYQHLSASLFLVSIRHFVSFSFCNVDKLKTNHIILILLAEPDYRAPVGGPVHGIGIDGKRQQRNKGQSGYGAGGSKPRLLISYFVFYLFLGMAKPANRTNRRKEQALLLNHQTQVMKRGRPKKAEQENIRLMRRQSEETQSRRPRLMLITNPGTTKAKNA